MRNSIFIMFLIKVHISFEMKQKSLANDLKKYKSVYIEENQ